MAVTAEYVRVALRAHATKIGSQRKLARRIGCSSTLLNDILRCKKEPSGKVLAFLRLRRVISYLPTDGRVL